MVWYLLSLSKGTPDLQQEIFLERFRSGKNETAYVLSLGTTSPRNWRRRINLHGSCLFLLWRTSPKLKVRAFIGAVCCLSFLSRALRIWFWHVLQGYMRICYTYSVNYTILQKTTNSSATDQSLISRYGPNHPPMEGRLNLKLSSGW